MKKWLLMLALTATAGLSFAAGTGDDAKAFVQEQSQYILQELRANEARYKSDPVAFQQFIESNVAPTLAFDQMAKIALGRHLQEVTNAGKFEAFRDAFRQLLIRVYSSNWHQYTNAEISVLGVPTVDKYQRARARLKVTDNGGNKKDMEFALWYDGTNWKVYDVTFTNISLISGYRNTFDTEISSLGIDALIAKMQTMQ